MTTANITPDTPENNAKAFPLRASPEARRKADGGAQLEFSVRVVMDDEEILERAREILSRRLRQSACVLSSPAVVRDYLTMRLAAHEHEVFGVLWMDAQNRLIEDESMFRGTLTQTSVYPREVVKSALHKNAAACILYHNHPSGSTEPSRADELLTKNLKDALAMIDVRVLDHLIVAGMAKPTSFAERGLI